jgi:hypothetical protein
MQQLPQALLYGGGAAAKGDLFLMCLYLVLAVLALRATHTGSLDRIVVAHAWQCAMHVWKLPFMWDEEYWAVRTDAAFLIAAIGVHIETRTKAYVGLRTVSGVRAAVVARACEIVPMIMATFYASSGYPPAQLA